MEERGILLWALFYLAWMGKETPQLQHSKYQEHESCAKLVATKLVLQTGGVKIHCDLVLGFSRNVCCFLKEQDRDTNFSRPSGTL